MAVLALSVDTPDRVGSYHGYRFPPEIISHAVWLYHRFCLSFRDTEDLLAQRGITVSHLMWNDVERIGFSTPVMHPIELWTDQSVERTSERRVASI